MHRWILLTSLIACGPAPEPDPSRAPIEVEVGTGISAYESLDGGETVVMTHGPQGAWHFDVAGFVRRAPEIIGLQVRIRVDSTDEELTGEPLVSYVQLVDYSPGDGSGYFFAHRAVFGDLPHVDQAFVCTLEAETLEICSEVVDPEDGFSGIGCVRVRAALDPVDVAENCP